MYRAQRSFIPAVLSALVLGACAGPPQRAPETAPGDYEYLKSRVQWQAKKTLREQKLVGLSMALVDADEIVWAGGLGLADRERGTPATARTRYRLGAVSKLLTATAAMRLAEDGALALDRPLRDYLPQLAIESRFDDGGPVTLRQLVSHHSGLPDGRIQGMWSRDPAPFTHVVDELRGEYLAQPNGRVLAYSDLGYSLLGHAVQNAAGESFESYVKRAVLDPAGMQDAGYSAYAPVGENAAAAYRARDGERVRPYGLRDLPAGGLNASVTDLGRFLQTLFAAGQGVNGRVLGAASVAAMARPQNPGLPLDRGIEVGLGWFLRHKPDMGTMLVQAGATLNYRAYLAALPESQLGVALLTNSDADLEVLAGFGEEVLGLLWEAKTGRSRASADSVPQEPPGDGMSVRSADFEGYFDTLFGFAAVRADGEDLQVQLDGEALDLVALGNGRFSIRTRILGLFPKELEQAAFALESIDGREVLFWRNGDGRWQVIGEKLPPLPISPNWHRRLGRYRMLDPGEMLAEWSRDAQIRLLERDGLLLAEVSRRGRLEQVLALAPLDEHTAVIRGLGSGKGATVKITGPSAAERVHYSGLVLERIAD